MGARLGIAATISLVILGLAGPVVGSTDDGRTMSGARATGFQPITNETVWKTVAGKEIRANAGNIIRRDGVFYWFGMRYDGTITAHVFSGKIRLNEYSSNDLSHWSRVQTIISYDTEAPPPDDPDVQWYGRPDVLYNPVTKTYVLTVERNVGNRNELAFYTASSPTGHFTWLPGKEIALPDGLHTMGDKGAFKDADGHAYLLFVSDDDAPAAYNTHVKIAPFTDDYLGLKPVISDCGGGGHEALSIVKHAESYYLLSSRTWGWLPSATMYKKASTLSGFACQGGDDGHGWNLVDTVPTSPNSFNTQHDFVLTIQGSRRTSYLYAGDRWSQFDVRVKGIGRYGWYPLTFDSAGVPVVNGLPSWSINASTGQWRP